MPSIRLVTVVVVAVAILSPAAGHAAPACPQAIAFDPASGMSRNDTGFTGIAQDRPVYGNGLRLAVSCAATTPPCGTCTITGVLRARRAARPARRVGSATATPATTSRASRVSRTRIVH